MSQSPATQKKQVPKKKSPAKKDTPKETKTEPIKKSETKSESSVDKPKTGKPKAKKSPAKSQTDKSESSVDQPKAGKPKAKKPKKSPTKSQTDKTESSVEQPKAGKPKAKKSPTKPQTDKTESSADKPKPKQNKKKGKGKANEDSEKTPKPTKRKREKEDDDTVGLPPPIKKARLEQLAKNVYIANLPFKTTFNQLATFFVDCGRVSSFLFVQTQKKRKNVGGAVVSFETSEAAIKALGKTGTIGGGKFDLVILPQKQESRVDPNIILKDKPLEPEKAIFVSNLPFSATFNQVSNFFISCGPVKEFAFRKANYISQQKHGKSHGLAFVVFVSEASVRKALLKNGQTMPDWNKPLKVSLLKKPAVKPVAEEKSEPKKETTVDDFKKAVIKKDSEGNLEDSKEGGAKPKGSLKDSQKKDGNKSPGKGTKRKADNDGDSKKQGGPKKKPNNKSR